MCLTCIYNALAHLIEFEFKFDYIDLNSGHISHDVVLDSSQTYN